MEDEAREILSAVGFTRVEILESVATCLAIEVSGDVGSFVVWIQEGEADLVRSTGLRDVGSSGRCRK